MVMGIFVQHCHEAILHWELDIHPIPHEIPVSTHT